MTTNQPYSEDSEISANLNVLGMPLEPCSVSPMTGFFRNGCCETGPKDRGRHIICVLMTDDFLAFSKAHGNDLSTPMPQFNFPGLKAGDRWCLCLERWREAYVAGKAPNVFLESTHQIALERIELSVLEKFAVYGDNA
ncbi:hypothetical protein DES40_0561 [Litorimonas taeanensis]|uniref:DUF2237 family protein n=1 Tax=Litorimonas taeanensis TaxID=568099 RepID=A0A420WJS0_9PROT|nr:DUF2237 domain-containing protein [Litorimonas taeanensis]RKQ71248.1 hypothetical protein DES40_0561 [Litorimonas taeanensis]